ncbi:MAG TPA: ATP-binding cassette domain-containing protein [Ilumatobacter sp.]|nr:ATP-binding cassette domain-containing protein [Ilumatobacter sp.]
MPAISVNALGKTFKVPVRESGLAASAKSLLRRAYRDVIAVADVDISIDVGEVVGFLGPNGAGKTTTLKMLSGLLQPSAGEVRVLGYEPQRRQHEYLRRMALVMGNRNQLQWDLPATDSFELTRAIYRIGRADFESQRDELVELLDLGSLLDKPVRNLSLGERMKAEIANSLLHRPEVLFLDEPTLGLDVTMQRRIRGFLGTYNARHGACIMLTTHYMADVEALCERVIVIHHGSVLFDGALRELADRFAGHKTLTVTLESPADLSAYGEVLEVTATSVRLRVGRDQAAAATQQLLSDLPVRDLTVEDPPIEDVIELAFASGAVTPP